MLLRRIPLAGCLTVALVAATSAASGQAVGVSGVERLRDYLADHGKVVIALRPQVAVRVGTEVAAYSADGCTATLRTAVTSSDQPSLDKRTESRVRFGALSPEVETVPIPESQIYRVEAVTTSGAADVEATTTEKGQALPRPAELISVLFRSAPQADTVRHMLQGIISRCGGIAQSAQVRAKMRGERAAVLASVDSLTGKVLSPSERTAIIDACQIRAKAKLSVPGDPRFQEPTISVGRDGVLFLFGTVEAPNGLGGLVSRTYSCTFERYGKEYAPTNVLVL